MREEFVAAMPEVESRLEGEVNFGGTLMDIYGPALESVMSPEALATRSIMRGAAVLHAATNSLMSIKGSNRYGSEPSDVRLVSLKE